MLWGWPITPPAPSGSDRPRAADHLVEGRVLPQRQVMRAKIWLLAAAGVPNMEIARRLGCLPPTVGTWCPHFHEAGMDGLGGPARPRPTGHLRAGSGGPGSEPALEPSAPGGETHWSTRSLAAKVGISHATVHRIWRTRRIQPHRSSTYKFSADPRLIEKVGDVVGLFLDPPEKVVVLSVDEKSQIQALDRTQPLLPLRPGQIERRSHDYVRHGTTTLFAAPDVDTGEVAEHRYARYRHQDFLGLMRPAHRTYPRAQIHLVLDSYATHPHPSVQAWLRTTRAFTCTSLPPVLAG
jgi:hypothetical protein